MYDYHELCQSSAGALVKSVGLFATGYVTLIYWLHSFQFDTVRISREISNKKIDNHTCAGRKGQAYAVAQTV